jgi:cytochrome c oxidase subunit IV
MAKTLQEASYKVYWLTWLVLLLLTLAMILIGSASLSRGWIASLLILGMFVKAALIGGNFMHLRFERLTLVLTVAVGILFTAAALFFLIAPDGMQMLKRPAY